jgi:hypothetical protein
MTARWEVDLETERIQVDGSWMSREDLSARLQQMLASGDFKISKLSEALEHLAQASGNARTLSFKLSAEQYARLEAAGQKLGKPAQVFGRDLLLQVLSGTASATAPVTITSLPPAAPVISAPAMATASTTAAGTTEDAVPLLTITPKKKDPLSGSSQAVPPVLTPVAVPTLSLPGDADETGKAKAQGGAPGDGRRWFNRT